MCSHMSSSELRHCFNDSLPTLSNTAKFAATDDRGKAELEGTRARRWRGTGAKGGRGGVIKYSSVCPNLAWRQTSQLHASPAAAADWDKNGVVAAAAVTAHCSVLARCSCGRKAKLGLLPCGHKLRASGDPETLRCSVVVVSRCYQSEEIEGSRKVRCGVTLPTLVYDILPFGGGAGKRVWCGVCRLRPKSQHMWINSELYSFWGWGWEVGGLHVNQ